MSLAGGFSRIDLSAESGLFVLADHSAAELRGETSDDLRAAAQEAAGRGEVFFVYEEDPPDLRVAWWIGAEAPEDRFSSYRRQGGAFRLEVPTGRLRLFTPQVGEAQAELKEAEIEAEPGTYQVLVWAPEEPDPQELAARERKLLGEADHRFHRRLMALGTAGCLLWLPALAILLIPGLRRLWPAALVLLLPWLLFLALSRLPRSRRIEGRLKGPADLSAYVLQLVPIDPSNPLPGGWLLGP